MSSNLRNSTTPSIRPDPEQNSKTVESLTQELQRLELLPLVLDIAEDVNSGRLLPKDVDNAAGTIRVRISKAREILRNIHGLSETPEERVIRVERLTSNIERKKKSLAKLRELVEQRFELLEAPKPQVEEPSTVTSEPLSFPNELEIAPVLPEVELLEEPNIPLSSEIPAMDKSPFNNDETNLNEFIPNDIPELSNIETFDPVQNGTDIEGDIHMI